MTKDQLFKNVGCKYMCVCYITIPFSEWPPQSPGSSSSTWGYPRLHLGSSFLHCSLETSLSNILGKSQDSPHLFPLSWGSLLSLCYLMASSRKPLFYISSQVLVVPELLKEESSSMMLSLFGVPQKQTRRLVEPSRFCLCEFAYLLQFM